MDKSFEEVVEALEEDLKDWPANVDWIIKNIQIYEGDQIMLEKIAESIKEIVDSEMKRRREDSKEVTTFTLYEHYGVFFDTEEQLKEYQKGLREYALKNKLIVPKGTSYKDCSVEEILSDGKYMFSHGEDNYLMTRVFTYFNEYKGEKDAVAITLCGNSWTRYVSLDNNQRNEVRTFEEGSWRPVYGPHRRPSQAIWNGPCADEILAFYQELLERGIKLSEETMKIINQKVKKKA